MGWFKWPLILLIVLIALVVWYCRPQPPRATTRLELESYGGFAYIHTLSEHKVEIAFLKDAFVQEPDPTTNQPRTVCEVDQLVGFAGRQRRDRIHAGSRRQDVRFRRSDCHVSRPRSERQDVGGQPW